MKTFSISLLILILSVFNHNASFSQENLQFLENVEPIHFGKLYLHTDREFYFQGDSVWFKAYYLQGQTHQLFNGFYNLYVNLIDENGDIIQSQVQLFSDGVASGNIKISDTVEPGNYLLRAYTDFQKNFGEYAFFHKTLNISKVQNSIEREKDMQTKEDEKKPEIDVAFLPEGGYLLANRKNIVAIKAVDESGRGISVSGKIIGDNGEIATQFKTEYKGMCKVLFTPKKGVTYKAQVDNYPNATHIFNDIVNEGIKIEWAKETHDQLLIRVVSNTPKYEKQNYYFAIMHRGETLFYEKFDKKKKDFQFRIDKTILPPGINRFVLLDANLKPISERLIFSDNHEINNLNIEINNHIFETRSNVELEISDSKEYSDSSFSSLSVSVIDENAIGKNGMSQNINSWLLLNSELKGFIESPADYFIDDENISSTNKLDLLMLTHGWNKYLWNTISTENIATDFNQVNGITIKGKAKRLFSKKPIVNGDIILFVKKGEFFNAFESKTDSNGLFRFNNILFTDSASLFVQARNEKGRKSTEVSIGPLFEENPDISHWRTQSLKNFSNVPFELYRQKYYSDLAMKEFDPTYNTIMLGEVKVQRKKREVDDGHFRIYNKPRTSLKITEHDYASPDILSYLQGRVPGLYISGDVIRIRGASSLSGGNTSPLILLDGMPIEDGISTIRAIPMFDIDKVEVLKSPNEIAIFGSRGANGVISIFTKTGDDVYTSDYVKGAISKQVVGYASLREFYSPKYTIENIDSPRPDHRTTLYWNPNVFTENGKASLSFFTSDDISRFKIFIEGITNDGTVCLGTAGFTVSNTNNISK